MGGGAMNYYGWVEIIFVGVVALGLGFWQLWSINREIARDRAKDGEKAAKDKGDGA